MKGTLLLVVSLTGAVAHPSVDARAQSAAEALRAEQCADSAVPRSPEAKARTQLQLRMGTSIANKESALRALDNAKQDAYDEVNQGIAAGVVRPEDVPTNKSFAFDPASGRFIRVIPLIGCP
jgi:hypothetical protein